MSEEELRATPLACISMGVSSVLGLSMPAMKSLAESELKRGCLVSLAAVREQNFLAEWMYSPAITAGGPPGALEKLMGSCVTVLISGLPV